MSHDKLAMRLAQILLRLNSGEILDIKELAEEFEVHKRTILRDLDERLNSVPIKREKGKFFLESFALGKLSFKDIEKFAVFSGISELYPTLSANFIADLLDGDKHSNIMVKNDGFEKIDYDKFEQINQAILQHQILSFNYKEKKRKIKPYKMINNKGIWYLLGDEQGILKHFALNKMLDFVLENKVFVPEENLKQQIKDNQKKWLGKDIEVILWIDQKAKDYFFRKKVLNNFEMIREDSAGFVISTKVSYEGEMISVVQQWIPYIKILEPIELKNKLTNILRQYIDEG